MIPQEPEIPDELDRLISWLIRAVRERDAHLRRRQAWSAAHRPLLTFAEAQSIFSTQTQAGLPAWCAEPQKRQRARYNWTQEEMDRLTGRRPV